MFYLIILAIIVAVVIYIYIKFRRQKEGTTLCFGGGLGTGKTFNGTMRALKFLRKARRKWKRINYPFFSWLWLWIPYFNKKRLKNEYYNTDKPMLYSSYPIIVNPSKKNFELSQKLTNDIMFERVTIPFGSQVVRDEFSKWINQFNYNEAYSETLDDHITYWRHYHGDDSHLIVIDQATDNIPLQVRRKLNMAIICQKTKHYLKFIHITYYKAIQLIDDIKNVENVEKNDSDTDDKTLKIITFSFKRRYDSRYASNRYWYVDHNERHTKLIDSCLKTGIEMPKPMPKEKYPILDIEIKKYLDKIALSNKDCQN